MSEVLRRGVPGLKSVMDLPVRQDGPPPGGFFPIRFGKRIPNTGPAGTTMLMATLGVMTYGWFQVRRGMDNRAAEKEEKRRARLALVPTLVAERDARMAAYQAEWNKLEAKIMSDHPDWEVGKNHYKTTPYMPPMSQFHPMRRLAAFH